MLKEITLPFTQSFCLDYKWPYGPIVSTKKSGCQFEIADIIAFQVEDKSDWRE